MAVMPDAAQPDFDKQIIAAMTCNHACSVRSTPLSKFLGGAGATLKLFNLTNPVFII